MDEPSVDTLLSPYFSLHDGGERAFSVEAASVKFGPGVLAEVGADVRALGLQRVALFTDPRVRLLPPFEIAYTSLIRAGLDVVVYDGIVVEPTERSVGDAAVFAREAAVDGFVSLGGGSTVDTTKVANLLSSWPAPLLDYVNAPAGRALPVPGPLKPHVACPTTFGTASETTGIAVFDLAGKATKTGIVSRRIRPTLGVLDPDNLAHLPPTVVAANGFDVLSHAIESYTARPFTARPAPAEPGLRPLSQGANPLGDLACLEAILRCSSNLQRALDDPAHRPARQALMFAGLLAGIGFGNSGCHLPHAMSYPVSSPVAGKALAFRAPDYPAGKPLVPHGIAVIVNAPAALRFTATASPQRHRLALAALAEDGIAGSNRAAADCTDAEVGDLLADRLSRLMRAAGIPNGLTGLGYGREDIDRLADGAFQQKRLVDNAPVAVSLDALRSIYRTAFSYW